MSRQITLERRMLQLSIALAASVAVGAGLGGVLGGAHFLAIAADTTADSHLRYLCGLLLGVGLGFWSTIPGIEKHGVRIRILSFAVVCGGVARLAAAFSIGIPHGSALLALANETVIPVLICIWQFRIAKKNGPFDAMQELSAE